MFDSNLLTLPSSLWLLSASLKPVLFCLPLSGVHSGNTMWEGNQFLLHIHEIMTSFWNNWWEIPGYRLQHSRGFGWVWWRWEGSCWVRWLSHGGCCSLITCEAAGLLISVKSHFWCGWFGSQVSHQSIQVMVLQFIKRLCKDMKRQRSPEG